MSETSQKKNEIGKRKEAKKRKSNISAVGQRILLFCVPGQIFPRAVFVLNHVHQAMRVYTFMQPLPSSIQVISSQSVPSPSPLPPPFLYLTSDAGAVPHTTADIHPIHSRSTLQHGLPRCCGCRVGYRTSKDRYVWYVASTIHKIKCLR